MKLIREIGKAFLVGIIVFLILNGISLLSGANIKLDNSLLVNFIYNQMYALVLYLSNAYFFEYLHIFFGKKEKYSNKRLIVGAVGSVTLTMVLIFFLRIITEVAIEGETWNEFVTTETPSIYLIAFVITLIFSLFFHAFYFYKALQEKKVKEQKVIAGTASAKFDALKNQLDPHFLFNSLNVLTSLIDENPDNAQKFTTSLSKVYRYVLEQKNKDLVTVDEELDFAKTYMSLLKMRFEDSIVFTIPEKASNPESKVVPLSLQLLLENAVKHNTVTSGKPLHIKIYEDQGNLVVENTLQPKQIVKKSSGVGLNNIKQRYYLLTDRKVSIQQEANSFAVAIPMLTKKITVMKTRTQSQYDDSYVRARKHVQEIKEFYYSVIAYVFVIPFLIFINYKTSWHFQWFWFPMFGWGMGLAFHAYKVYVNDGVLGRSWERKKIEEFMREEESNKKNWK
jgi:hypothetical protein